MLSTVFRLIILILVVQVNGEVKDGRWFVSINPDDIADIQVLKGAVCSLWIISWW